MNIYFTISYRGAEKYGDTIKTIVDKLVANGHKVHKRIIRSSEADIKQAKTTTKDIVNLKNEELPDIYKTIIRRIRESDILIADTSVPSSGVGYEIAMAQSEKKPILVLHNHDSKEYIADVLGGNTSKIVKFAIYSSADDALTKVNDFMKRAKESIDTKFILIISPEIDKYLEWAGEERRMHKAQIVRNAIEEMMSKDKEYKDFLKDQALSV